DFRLALVELGTNTLRHGVSYGSEAAMSLYFLKFDQLWLIVYTDPGKSLPLGSIDNSQHLVKNLGDIPVNYLPEGGFGLSIISSIAPLYDYQYSAKRNYHFLGWPR
ncbi:MAG: hypothetical protein R3194_12415, partial [Limnobacter sp.]|nr:hypothetical protein [Limnobacter sp.]